MTTPGKPTATGGNPGNYDYASLLKEFSLVLRKFDWMDNAACKGMTNINFFPESRYKTEAPQAVAVCRNCRVQQECRDFAITNGIEHGVWGGMTAIERKQWRRDSVIP